MSKKPVTIEDGIALLSVHDITPQYEDAVVKIGDRLQDIGVNSYSLLVTPFFDLKRMNIFDKAELFAEYLTSLNLEISLHGYTHKTKSGSMAEFQRMPHDQIVTRLKQGISLIRKNLGVSPVGFVPPLWTAPPSIVKLTESLGLRYCVIEDIIFRNSDGSRFNTSFHLVSQGRSSLDTTDALLELELGGPVQIAVHPLDNSSDTVFNLLCDMKDRLEYRFCGYADYLAGLKK